MTAVPEKDCGHFYDYDFFSMHVPDDKRKRRFLDAMMKIYM